MTTPHNTAQDWDDYDDLRNAWLSRLLFGGFLDPPMSAGPPPEPPSCEGSRGAE